MPIPTTRMVPHARQAGRAAGKHLTCCCPPSRHRVPTRPVSLFVQLACLGTHPWGRGALSAHGVVTLPCEGREGGAFIQALQFDASGGGELLVAGSDEGLLSVHSTPQLLQQLPRGAGGGLLRSPGQAADPLLLLDCGMPRLHSVRWDPRQGAVVGVTSTATRQLLLFDLEHTQVGVACLGRL
jgi:hypothetical protein